MNRKNVTERKKIMKKYLAILLALVMTFTLCACGAQKEDTPPAEDTSDEATSETTETGWVPEKNISVIVPYGAGDGIDILTRTLVDHLDVPVNVVVENISGGGGSIGAEDAFNRAADGYTVLCLANSPAISQTILNDTITYNTTDWTPVAEMSARCGIAMCSQPSLGLEDSAALKEFLESGETFTFGVPQMSGGVYVAAASTFKEMGIIDNCTFVSYDGIPALYQAYLAGEVDFAAFDDNLALGYAKDNPDVVVNVILGAAKSVFFPDLDCIADWGYEGLDGNVIVKYLAVRSDTPAEIIDYLSEKFNDAMLTDSYQQWVVDNDFGDYPVPFTAEETAETVSQIKDLYYVVFEEAGLISK